MFKKERI
ncbi:2120b6e0-c2f0-4ca4-978e-148f298b50b2 [Thermothielavioides terrestris]|nr:2120b6e0-c2f0-4ca4-978e-148f298b50b2 [Thermothielavioides terrestris]